jgi:hypothetical protein
MASLLAALLAMASLRCMYAVAQRHLAFYHLFFLWKN